MISLKNLQTQSDARIEPAQAFAYRLFFSVVMIAFSLMLLCPNSVVAQSKSGAPTDWRAKRRTLDRELADSLQEIANWCRGAGMPNQVKETFKLYSVRDLDRQFIFLPSEKSMPQPANVADGALAKWLEKINDVKRAHAAKIFSLAEEAANENYGATAFQLLHEVIHFDRDHQAVRKILGHKKTDTGWRVTSEKVKLRTASKQHPVLDWPAKSYFNVRTPHFEINSNATKEQTLELAAKLERWHYIWRQLFFDYWSKPSAVRKWIKGDGGLRMPTKKFEVVFFKDKTDYVRNLSRWVKGVEGSIGYYNPEMKLSFFPAGDDERTTDTWRHELNHQLFRETIRTRDLPFKDGFLWLDEGIAMYFESLTDFGDYVTLGGFESRRLQFARILLMRQNIQLKIGELAGMSKAEFQTPENRQMRYSQSAGVAHLLMDGGHGTMQPAVVEFMQMVHKGKLKQETFQKLLRKTYVQLDELHKEFLKVNNSQVEKNLSSPETRTELALPSAELTADAFEQIGKCTELTWLDLTGNTVRKSSIVAIENCDKLEQLFLTNCPIEPSAIDALQLLGGLEEIDFSGSSIEDSQIQFLSAIENLSVLRLAYTGITDNGLRILGNVKNLTVLELTGSRVSAAGIAAFQSRNPSVQIVK